MCLLKVKPKRVPHISYNPTKAHKGPAWQSKDVIQYKTLTKNTVATRRSHIMIVHAKCVRAYIYIHRRMRLIFMMSSCLVLQALTDIWLYKFLVGSFHWKHSSLSRAVTKCTLVEIPGNFCHDNIFQLQLAFFFSFLFFLLFFSTQDLDISLFKKQQQTNNKQALRLQSKDRPCPQSSVLSVLTTQPRRHPSSYLQNCGDSQLVSWCLDPSQAQRITPGLIKHNKDYESNAVSPPLTAQ